MSNRTGEHENVQKTKFRNFEGTMQMRKKFFDRRPAP